MRRLGLLIAVFALGLVIACGGGDDDGGDDGDGGNGGNNEPTATASSGGSSNDSNNNNDNDNGDGDNGDDRDGDNDDGDNRGAGANSDFCSPDNLDSIFDSTDFTNFSDLQSEFERLDSVLDTLRDNAPGEIEDDVDTVIDGFRGLIELLEENDYNFLALASAQDDPRLLFLDSDEFSEASERIANYCDFDTGDSGVSVPGSGGNPGGGSFSVDLPDDFPSELVPPNSEVGAVVDAGFGLTVEFTSEATADEVKAFYEDELGAPTFADSESILWASGTRNVTINGSDGNVTIVIIITG